MLGDRRQSSTARHDTHFDTRRPIRAGRSTLGTLRCPSYWQPKESAVRSWNTGSYSKPAVVRSKSGHGAESAPITCLLRLNQRHIPGQPAAPVVLLDGLCPVVRYAPHRSPRHPVRPGHLRHHSSQAAQDRRPRASECPPHQGRDGVGLSGRAALGARCHQPRRRRKRSRLAGVTRASAARLSRGITNRPTETHKIADTNSAVRRHERAWLRTSSRQN